MMPGVLDILRGRADRLSQQLDASPELVNRRFPELECGSTGGRRLLLQGGTLLHVAAEYGGIESAKLLIRRGASVNARASLDKAGAGGQTPIFHAVTQFDDRGFAMAELLLQNGADLSVRVKLPGHYERPDELVECTPLGYALRFPGAEFPGSNEKTVRLLREKGGKE
jgi:ankyrin repeat protein